MSNNRTMTVTLPIPDVACESIMSTAIEGGIGYWSVASSIVYAAPGLQTPLGRRLTDDDEILYWSYQLQDSEHDGNPEWVRADAGVHERFEAGKEVEVNYSVIRDGIRLLLSDESFKDSNTYDNFLKDHFEWMAFDNGPIWGGCSDASDCDVIVQLGLFGEVVYG